MSRSREAKNAGMKVTEVFLSNYELAKLSYERQGETDGCYSGNLSLIWHGSIGHGLKLPLLKCED